MARVTVEDCLDNIENRFVLVKAATHRARQLTLGGSESYVEWENDKPPVVALREIAEGYGYVQDQNGEEIFIKLSDVKESAPETNEAKETNQEDAPTNTAVETAPLLKPEESSLTSTTTTTDTSVQTQEASPTESQSESSENKKDETKDESSENKENDENQDK